MILSLIAAVAENNVIGIENRLPWHLPADLRFFKELTTGHTIIMGRKTYESIGKPLPNRTSVVITRRGDFKAEGCKVVYSLDEALASCEGEEEVFLIGGAEMYRVAMEKARRLYITRVHAVIEGDTFFPDIDPAVWKEVRREDHPADDRHAYAYSFVVFERMTN